MEAKTNISKHFLIFIFSLILMAAGISSFAAVRFVDNGDGTISDQLTELTWVQDPAIIPELSGEFEWIPARDACRSLVFAGIGPNVWRLPRISELESLLDSNFKNPQINTGFFTAEAGTYWSQTPYNPGYQAWTVDFKNGVLGAGEKFNPDKPDSYLVRCVAKV